MEKRIAGCSGLLLVFCLAACGPREQGLTSERFAEFYAEVVRVQASVTDSIAAVDSALAICERMSMDSLELADFRNRLSDHPEEWIRVWELVMQEIEERGELDWTTSTKSVAPHPLPEDKSDSLSIKKQNQ